MKGNQGLEALAALCNNARKSNEDIAINESKNNLQQQNLQNVSTHAPSSMSSLSYSSNNDNQQGNTRQGFNFIPPHFANMLKSLGPGANHQQFANLLSNSAGMAGNNDASNALQQQLNYMNNLQAHPSLLHLMGQSNQGLSGSYPFGSVDANAMNALFIASQRQNGNFQLLPNGNNTHQNMVDNNVMKSSAISPSTVSHHQPIMMRNDDGTVTDDRLSSGSVGSTEDKKLQKRAANRRSAQLSRKRKKQFIEELKEENDDLRRKEQILRSIPDLIVVFDSSGKLGFVSHSVSNFLEFAPDELIGRSFWERLCEESVRLLKAAFMDALAARNSESDTIPLGSGVWELRLQDKNGAFVLVTLNGVVHFSGDAPECVCSIRPMQSGGGKQNSGEELKDSSNPHMFSRPVHEEKAQMSNLIYGTIKPEQSVADKEALPYQRNVRQKVATGPDGRPVAISDTDSGTSVVSSE
mmetsp:Transcript_7394/g.14001  ORF Transcript_7394/g.14001 Transcript_7394/m.14001 type:complete len:467 (+) Transcript_7394:4777-6177(+)